MKELFSKNAVFFRKYFKSDQTNEVFKNMAKLSSGVGIGKVIGFISLTILTRIYSPEDFGILSLFASIIAVLVPISSLSYSVAIPLPKSTTIAINLVTLSWVTTIIQTTLISIVFLLGGSQLFEMFQIQELYRYWYLIVLGFLIVSIYDVLIQWSTRVKAFTIIAKTKVWQSSISAITKITLGLVGLKPLGLLLGDIFQNSGGIISLFRVLKNDLLNNLKDISFKRILFIIKYYSQYPKYRLPSQFLLKVSTQAPVLFFAYQYGVYETGQLGLAMTILAFPITLIANSTGRAFYAEIALLGPKKKDEIRELTYNVVQRMFLLAIIPALILFFFSPFIFELFFGTKWILAGVYTSILSIYLLLSFVTNPLMSVLNVFNNQIKYLEINLVRVIALLFIFSVSIYFSFKSEIALAFYAIFLIVHLIYSGFQVYRQLKK